MPPEPAIKKIRKNTLEFKLFLGLIYDLSTRLNIEPYSLLKPTKVGFIFMGPKILELSIT